MKTSKIILIALLVLPVFSTAKDEHKFSSGFSSGKSTSASKSASGGTVPKPVKKEAVAPKKANAASPGTAKSSFGSFGGAKAAQNATPPATAAAATPATPAATTAAATTGGAAAAGAKSTSALSQSLDKSAAQANALKTLDARNAQKAPVVTGNNFPQGASVSPPVQVAPPPIPPPQVVYQNAPSSSGWNSGIMGFLLGNSMSRSDRSYNSHSGYGQGNSASSSPDVADDQASGSTFLRVVAWLLILGAIGGLVWYFMNRSSAKAAAAAAKRNYSL